MKRVVRGRRVAFLLASALPLLADDEIAPLGNNAPTNQTRHLAADQHAAPNVKATTTRVGEEYVEEVNDLPAHSTPRLLRDKKAMPTKMPTTQHLLDGESNWGSLDSLWAVSNDSILPFFPLDQEYEMASFRGASRQPREILESEPIIRTSSVENMNQQTEQQNSTYSETNSTLSESSDLLHDTANTPSMEPSVASSESNETSAKQSEEADHSKHVAEYGSRHVRNRAVCRIDQIRCHWVVGRHSGQANCDCELRAIQ
jgi:hypothetical protein